MKSLILILLFVALQTSISSPNQASNKGGEQGQQNARSQKKIASAPSGQSAPDSSDQNASGTKDKSQNNEVKVSTLPDKIRIQSIKDAIDWTILGCTIVLTVVGVTGTVIALKTLFAIQRQAEIMDEHRASLEELSEAANKNAGAARDSAIAAKDHIEIIINKERARLWIETPQKLNLSVDAPIFISYKLFYEGFTPAFNVTSEVNALISAIKDFPDSGFKQKVFSLPNVVSSKSDLQPQYSNFILNYGGSLRIKLDGETLSKVGESQMFVHFWGVIRYRDIFDRDRETTFRYRWLPGKDERYDRWETCGEPEDNRQK